MVVLSERGGGRADLGECCVGEDAFEGENR